MDILIAEYISKQVEHLANRNTCCLHWLGPFCNIEHVVVPRIAYLGLRKKMHKINGHDVTKIYKSSCNHSVLNPGRFQLTEHSQKDVLNHLKKCNNDSLQSNILISPQVFMPTRQKPVLPPNRFTIGPRRQTVYQTNAVSAQMLQQQSWRLFPFKSEILKKIHNNRVLVVNGDVSLEMETAIPMFIVEDCTSMRTYCKILCVESDNLSAITHCTVLAKNLGERVGSRVGFQVYLQSRVCDNTNLIYTTAIYFLRVLMGQNCEDSFLHISHIVVSDVHLHHAYTDILLYELKNILPYYPQIKIILLSNSSENNRLISYFGEGEELRLGINLYDVKLYYIEEIKLMIENDQSRLRSPQIVDDILPRVSLNGNVNEHYIDKALDDYEKTGSDTDLNRFLYFVRGENVPINYTHSKLGCTALIVAAKVGKWLHVNHLLSYENANPFVQDKHKFTALEYAISRDNVDCVRTLLNFMKENVYEHKPPPIDFCLIKKLIQLIALNWKFGHILILLPTYEDLLKLNYGILKLQFTGKIPQEASIYLLHSNMHYDELQPIIEDSTSVKIILSTKLAETFTYLKDISYVIDSSLNCVEKYYPESKCKASNNEWTSKESLQKRSMIASRFAAGYCFRLMPRKLFGKLHSKCRPELLHMPMNRLSMTAKLLCPHKMVAEYFRHTIVKPPLVHVIHSIEVLKKIEVFDCMEDITWLGCRLIDVPIDLELGKSLVLSILLKCLDPVLTIVSFLTNTEPKEIARCKRSITTESIFHKNEKQHFNSDGVYSDHLTLLRLYQLWENDKRESTVNDILSDEDSYVINGILDKVCGIRTHLVGVLRSSQLIHNQGQLSMHSINLKANNWTVIKAALVGGLYPKLCMIDRNCDQLKLKSKSRELCIHPSSTLRDSKNGKENPFYQNYPSDWIVFFRESDSVIVNSISNCSLISPVAIALFAGKSELDPENIVFPKIVGQKSPIDNSGYGYAAFYIDEWIWLATDTSSALLLYKLRQRFYSIYLEFLQTCGNNEKWRKSNSTHGETSSIFDLISKILLKEDVNSGFVQPNRVGNRPKAVANKYTSDFDFNDHPKTSTVRKEEYLILSHLIHYHCLDKEFFLINIFDSHEIMKNFYKLSLIDLSRDSFFEPICTSASLQKLTYVIVFSMNRKRFTNIALVKCEEGGYFLRNCFQTNIPVYEVKIMCMTYKLTLPPFRPDWNPVKLERSIGELILDLL